MVITKEEHKEFMIYEVTCPVSFRCYKNDDGDFVFDSIGLELHKDDICPIVTVDALELIKELIAIVPFQINIK